MFGEPVFFASEHVCAGPARWWSEFVATFGLLAVIISCSRSRPAVAPFAVAALPIIAGRSSSYNAVLLVISGTAERPHGRRHYGSPRICQSTGPIKARMDVTIYHNPRPIFQSGWRTSNRHTRSSRFASAMTVRLWHRFAEQHAENALLFACAGIAFTEQYSGQSLLV